MSHVFISYKREDELRVAGAIAWGPCKVEAELLIQLHS